jgi:hypothetical protein
MEYIRTMRAFCALTVPRAGRAFNPRQLQELRSFRLTSSWHQEPVRSTQREWYRGHSRPLSNVIIGFMPQRPLG